MFCKGQVSTEYLVVLAIILVVGLVVVYLIGGFAGMGGSNLETESMQAWGTAAPFAITNWKQTGSTLQMELRNNDINTLTLTGISMDNAVVYSANTTFTSGEKRLISVTTSTSCGATGTRFVHDNVLITYNKGMITGNTERGLKPIIGKCS
ncbi:hypothetical protein H0O00_05355 [Candidatus Micrarchaeota archaeon]|nr:hypothetical protein [Candidatus Micrarchaeota archaeon]